MIGGGVYAHTILGVAYDEASGIFIIIAINKASTNTF
jgi:hypothetical protein